MCGPHKDTDIIFAQVRRFGWQSFSTPLYHILSVALIFCSRHFHMHSVNIQ